MAELTNANTQKVHQTAKWKLHYNEAGEGPVVIMLHGSGPGATGWSNFNGNIHTLARKYRVILMDFPGWGLSDETDVSNSDRTSANAEAVKLLMDGLGIEKAALVGNSMGGMAALMFTGLHPERITHCVTMGAPSPVLNQHFFSPGGGLSEGLKILFAAYIDPTPENFRRLVSIMVFDSQFVTDALVEQRLGNAIANRTHLTNFLEGFKAGGMTPNVDQLALPGLLAQAKTPALIMHGRDDRVVNVEHSLSTVAVLQNSTLAVINRCGHWAQLEHATTFNGILDGFLSSTGELAR